MNRLELKPRCLQGLFDIHSGSLGGRDHWFALLQGSSISSPEVELCFISRNFHGQQHGKTRVVHHNKQSQPESENAEKHWTWQEIEDLNNMFQLDCLYFCCSICHISAIFLPYFCHVRSAEALSLLQSRCGCGASDGTSEIPRTGVGHQ